MQAKVHTKPLLKAAIVGARGYSGLDLARLVLRHPRMELSACFASSAATASWKLSDSLYEEAAEAVPTYELSALEPKAYDVVFLATPVEASLELAPKIVASGTDVIDLSGAFRLEPAVFEKWYAREHTAPELKATYGLVPWAGPVAKSKQGRLVANPGCYATSILMALIPILRSGLIKADTLVIDAKSGATGAGKKAGENLLFCEVDGDCLPYRVGKHQHLPEIQAFAKYFGLADIDPIFSTTLLPIKRGILSALYARLATGVSSADIQRAFDEAYSNYPLVAYRGPGLKGVVGSARTQLGWEITAASASGGTGDKLHLFSSIDNLMKGAASQAIENFNRLHDLPVAAGLLEAEGTL